MKIAKWFGMGKKQAKDEVEEDIDDQKIEEK